MLTAVSGDMKEVNRMLLLKAFELAPSLVVDCGNSADPHSIFHLVPEEKLDSVYVMNAEAIYRLRDSLKQAMFWARRYNCQCIVITTVHILFSYDDEEENDNVLEHCWEIMREISAKMPVYVGIAHDKRHHRLAGRYAGEIAKL